VVKRGEILFSYDFLDGWGYELERMNKNKKGKPFTFPNSFILAAGYIGYSFHLPYIQTEGTITATGKELLGHSPSYGHVCKRINKLKIDINREEIDEDDDYVVVSIDSIGIKVTNRGQWMSEKWNVQNKKKGFLKIQVAVDIRTKEIVALEVTDEKTQHGRIFKNLVNQVLDSYSSNGESKIVKMKSVLADGVYDSTAKLKYLLEKMIKSSIKVKKNSIISIRNNRLRNMEARLQSKDYLKWKKKRKYGYRWMAEAAFSTMKRMFGEYVSATRFQNMIKVMLIKISLYNLFRRL
jgi:hypothetical protein